MSIVRRISKLYAPTKLQQNTSILTEFYTSMWAFLKHGSVWTGCSCWSMDQCEQGVHAYPWISVNRVSMLIHGSVWTGCSCLSMDQCEQGVHADLYYIKKRSPHLLLSYSCQGYAAWSVFNVELSMQRFLGGGLYVSYLHDRTTVRSSAVISTYRFFYSASLGDFSLAPASSTQKSANRHY